MKKIDYPWWNPVQTKDEVANEAWEHYKRRENLLSDMTPGKYSQKNSEIENEKWDSFRHTYTSAKFEQIYGSDAAKQMGDLQEIKGGGIYGKVKVGNYNPSNTPKAREKDLWNNSRGRELGKQYENKSDDELADKIHDSIGKDIILDPNSPDNPRYEDSSFKRGIWNKMDEIYRNNLTGKAVPIQDEFTTEQVNNMLPEEFEANKDAINRQIQKKGLPSGNDFDRQDLSNYSNPEIDGSNRIFTREEINNMDPKDYVKFEKAIFHQTKTIGLPSKAEADKKVRSGGMVHVGSYTRSDGTKVSEYYRSAPSR